MSYVYVQRPEKIRFVILFKLQKLDLIFLEKREKNNLVVKFYTRFFFAIDLTKFADMFE